MRHSITLPLPLAGPPIVFLVLTRIRGVKTSGHRCARGNARDYVLVASKTTVRAVIIARENGMALAAALPNSGGQGSQAPAKLKSILKIR